MATKPQKQNKKKTWNRTACVLVSDRLEQYLCYDNHAIDFMTHEYSLIYDY